MAKVTNRAQRSRPAGKPQRPLNMSEEQLGEKNKKQLINLAKNRGIYDDIPRNGSGDRPLKEDLVEALAKV